MSGSKATPLFKKPEWIPRGKKLLKGRKWAFGT